MEGRETEGGRLERRLYRVDGSCLRCQRDCRHFSMSVGVFCFDTLGSGEVLVEITLGSDTFLLLLEVVCRFMSGKVGIFSDVWKIVANSNNAL